MIVSELKDSFARSRRRQYKLLNTIYRDLTQTSPLFVFRAVPGRDYEFRACAGSDGLSGGFRGIRSLIAIEKSHRNLKAWQRPGRSIRRNVKNNNAAASDHFTLNIVQSFCT